MMPFTHCLTYNLSTVTKTKRFVIFHFFAAFKIIYMYVLIYLLLLASSFYWASVANALNVLQPFGLLYYP